MLTMPAIAVTAGATKAALTGGAGVAAAGGTAYLTAKQMEASRKKKSFMQPWMIPLMTSGANALYRHISPDRAAEIMDRVLNSQIQMRNMMAEKAFGRLTPAVAEEIEQQSSPQVNAIAGNVASRGLGTSPAGAQIVSDAQRAAYTTAQREAAAQLPIFDETIMRHARSMLVNDSSFMEDLGSIAALLDDEIAGDPEGAMNDPEIQQIIQYLWEALGRPTP